MTIDRCTDGNNFAQYQTVLYEFFYQQRYPLGVLLMLFASLQMFSSLSSCCIACGRNRCLACCFGSRNSHPALAKRRPDPKLDGFSQLEMGEFGWEDKEAKD